MVVVLCDSFAVDVDAAAFAQRWTRSVNLSGVVPRQVGFDGGRAIKFTDLGAGMLEANLAPTTTEPGATGDVIIASMRVNGRAVKDDAVFMRVRDGAGAVQFEGRLYKERFGNDLMVKLYYGSTGEEFARTSVISADQWHHLSFKVTVHPTSGIVEIRLDDVQDFYAAGIRTAGTNGSGWKTFGLGGQCDAGGQLLVADLVVQDGTTSGNVADQTGDFLGPVIVEAMLPVADSGVGFNTMTGSPGVTTGTHYLNIDDGVPGTMDGDTTRLESNGQPTGAVEFFRMDGPRRVVGDVVCVCFSSDVKSATVPHQYAHGYAKPQGAVAYGPVRFTTFPLVNAYVRLANYLALEPGNSQAWDVDRMRDPAALFGIGVFLTPTTVAFRYSRFFMEVIGRSPPRVTPLPPPATTPPSPPRAVWGEPVSVSTSWRTTIRTESESGGEVAIGLVDRPTRAMDAVAPAIDGANLWAQWAKMTRQARPGEPQPLLSDRVSTTAASGPSGSGSLFPCDARYRRFYPGGRALVVAADPNPRGLSTTVRMVTVDFVWSYGIQVTDTGLPVFPVGSMIFPLVDADAVLTQEAELVTDGKQLQSVRLEERSGKSTLPPSIAGGIGAYYRLHTDGTPILERGHNWRDNPGATMSRAGEAFLSGKAVAQELDATRGASLFKLNITSTERKDAWKVLRLFDWARGMARTLYALSPTTFMTLRVINTTGSPASPVSFDIDALAGTNPKDLEDHLDYVGVVEPTRSQIWKVQTVTDIGGGRWRVAVVLDTKTVNPTLGSVKRFVGAYRVRFGSDTLTETWVNLDICEIALDLVESVDPTTRQVQGAIISPVAKAVPDAFPDLWMWIDAQKNVYQDMTNFVEEVPWRKGLAEVADCLQAEFYADRIFDARRELKAFISEKTPVVPHPYLIGGRRAATTTTWVSRLAGIRRMRGQRVLIGGPYELSTATATQLAMAERVPWSAKGMTIFLAFVDGNQGPWPSFAPKRIMAIRDSIAGSPIVTWDGCGVTAGTEVQQFKLHNPQGTAVAIMNQVPMLRWNTTALSPLITVAVAKWTPGVASQTYLSLGGNPLVGISGGSPSSLPFPSSGIIMNDDWLEPFNFGLIVERPPQRGGSQTPSRTLAEAQFSTRPLLLGMLIYRRALSAFEINAVANYYVKCYGATWRGVSI